MQRVFKVTADTSEDVCTKLQRLIDNTPPTNELRIFSICIHNGIEVAYCVEIGPDIKLKKEAPLIKLVKKD